MMKRFLLVLILAAAGALSAPAQNSLDSIREKMAQGKVSLDYSCTIKGTPAIKSSGSICIQRNCYSLRTAGMEIYCDGLARWIVDREAREVCIEQAQGVAEFLDDSEAYLQNLDELKITEVRTLPFDKDSTAFVFDTEKLSADWIVTDLR